MPQIAVVSPVDPAGLVQEREAPLAETIDPPDDPARARRLDWATLLRRTWFIDVLPCPVCQGRMRLIALIEDPRVAARILAHLGLPTQVPRPPPRRGQLRLELDPRFADAPA